MGVDPSPHSTLRRKLRGSLTSLNMADSHSHSGSSHRQSLAFELAAAMEPEENDQASILDQLGLGDHEEEPEDQAEEEDDDQQDFIYEDDEYDNLQQFTDHSSSLAQQLQEPGLRNQASRSTIASTFIQPPDLDNQLDLSPGKSSIRGPSLYTPIRTPKPRVSRSTLNTIDSSPRNALSVRDLNHPGQSSTEEEDDGKHDLTLGSWQSDEDLDSSEREGAGEILQAGLKSTANFLNLLKQSNTDYNVASRQTPSSSHPTHSSAAEAEETKPDRQPVVEKIITDIVRTMTEQVRDRESQIRELKEIEIALSRTDRRVLADLDALPNILEERDFRNSAILGKFIAQSDHPTLSLSKSIEDLQQLDPLDDLDPDDEDLLEDGRLTPTPHNAEDLKQIKLQEADQKSKPIENLGELKLITNSLISSLNQIHEHTQISRQTQTEIVRKLKGVKGLVFNWKSDFDSIQNSIDFISEWEHGLFPPTRDEEDGENEDESCRDRHKIRGIFEVQVKLATEEVEKLLNSAFLSASTLLQHQPAAPSCSS